MFLFAWLVLRILAAAFLWKCLCNKHTCDCSSAPFLCQLSFPDFMQRHEHCVNVAYGFFVSVLAVEKGKSSRHNRSQQMSLCAFLPLCLSFVSAVCRWSSPAETEGGWIKQENESNVAQPFCHHADLLFFKDPGDIFVVVFQTPTATLFYIFHLSFHFCLAFHPTLWWPFRNLGLRAESSCFAFFHEATQIPRHSPTTQYKVSHLFGIQPWRKQHVNTCSCEKLLVSLLHTVNSVIMQCPLQRIWKKSFLLKRGRKGR